MWAANLPYYSEYQSKRKPSVVTQNVDSNLSPTTSPTRPSHSPGQLSPRSINQLFEPAVDGPPSPERIRQLSKQAKRASHLNRPHGPRAVSSGSGSSSLRSLTGDRPSWEVALENMSLTRRPSNRSTGSSAPSRDRPDSIQAFGKSLLHRRGKSNRESGSHSSSGSSMYSADMPVESVGPSLKDSIMPAIFTRRPSRDESAHRRIHISNPFNFHHVTHTNRDDFPNSPRDKRGESFSEEASMHAADSGNGPIPRNAMSGDDLHFEDFSSEQPDLPSTRTPSLSRYNGPAPGPRRTMRHIRSQDQLRPGPTHSQRRPSLPPLEPTPCPPVPPIPPPRLSSRQSARLDEELDPLSTAMERPLTSSGYRRPQPRSPAERLAHATPSPGLGHEPPNFDGFSFGQPAVSYALTTPDDSAWPLGPSPTAYETPLADVPEEEEHHGVTRRSRVSLASNNSSLRGSHSVPALRSLAQSQQRMSETSDTLGYFEAASATAVGGGQFDHDAALWDGSWEEDIDYCYEHEAEANCDYQWERASVDVSRDRLPPAVQLALAEDELAEAKPMHSSNSFPNMLFAAPSDTPALSPVSQASTAASQDVSTPVFNPTPSNFSLPRGDRKAPKPSTLKQLRPISTSSFKESQGFTLSPSLLIPGDYHHQMLISASEKAGFGEDEDFIHHTYDRTDVRDSSSHLPQRVSTSTTGTSSTSHTDITGERHISTNSTWSSLTRHTTSSTSLNKMANSWTEHSEQLAEETEEEEEEQEKRDGQSMLENDEHKIANAASKDTVPELVPFPNTSFGRKPSHRSHASESVSRNDMLPMQSNEQPATRRPRARTTSVSTQTPPIAGYSLFPRSTERV